MLKIKTLYEDNEMPETGNKEKRAVSTNAKPQVRSTFVQEI